MQGYSTLYIDAARMLVGEMAGWLLALNRLHSHIHPTGFLNERHRQEVQTGIKQKIQLHTYSETLSAHSR